jgi:hypothetical protein
MDLKQDADTAESPTEVSLVGFQTAHAKLNALAKKADMEELALMSRSQLLANFDPVLDKIFALPPTRVNLMLQKDVLAWLANRGYGKTADVIRIGADNSSFEGVMRSIAAEKLRVLEDNANAIEAEVIEDGSGSGVQES